MKGLIIASVFIDLLVIGVMCYFHRTDIIRLKIRLYYLYLRLTRPTVIVDKSLKVGDVALTLDASVFILVVQTGVGVILKSK